MLAVTAVLMAAALGNLGCGSEGAEGADGGTRQITHAMGTTAVPAAPARVVVLDTGELEAATAVGIVPIGGVTALPGQPILAHLRERAASMEIVGTIEEPNLEAIAALEPDLILSSKIRHEKLYDRLSAIAPTVFAEQVGVTWKDNFLLYADALGRRGEAEAQLRAYEDRADQLGARIAELRGTRPTISVLRFLPGENRIYLSETFIGTVLADLGLPRPPAQRKKDFALYPSQEQIGLMDGGVIFYATYGPAGDTTEGAVTGSALWSRLAAVRSGDVHRVDDDHWFLGIGVQSANLVLDDIERLVIGDAAS
ncbi:MAG TPA: iron-siderophore ABC transporter substrate-binding protein [Miltoncostaeaceae bacterium]|nr:iron-siderophore ABC transporter substrate-binding protein [Miltoncostaeaceae bacterium]